MLVTGKQILNIAREKHFGIGMFNVFDYSDVDMVISGAEACGCPVMLGLADYNGDAFAPQVRLTDDETKYFMSYMVNRAKESTVPVCIHLDHCKTVEGCLRAIHNGATSVMIDASTKPFEENVAITKKVVELAHACGVTVEAEIGHVGGHGEEVEEGASESKFTTVNEAVKFYEATGVDYLAVAIGTVHGFYKEEPDLQFDRIKELREALPIPLVMHGGSGLTPEDYGKVVDCGICKINYATYLHYYAAEGAYLKAKEVEGKCMFCEIVKAGKARGKERVTDVCGYFKTQSISVEELERNK